MILMYHRVANPSYDPWGLAVRPERFEAQLAILRRTRCPLPMPEFVQRLIEGRLPRNAVGLTFDDGYADNLRQAAPRLRRAQVPATLFLATGTVGSRSEYWWDEAARAIFGYPGDFDSDVHLAGEVMRLTFDRQSNIGHAPWRAWEEPVTLRQRAYVAVWRRLRDLGPRELDSAMQALRTALRPPPSDPAELPMSVDEVVELIADGLVAIGGHTVTHPPLPTLGADACRREIELGRQRCEEIAGRPVQGFAYPYGAFDDNVKTAVKESDFRWACSTANSAVPRHGFDLYALPRLCVLDWTEDQFEVALRWTGTS
jgi:peptidoglycan/xylan/chitin deacetylase (PgdA/CDA1 family)